MSEADAPRVLVAGDTTADFYPREADDGAVGRAYRWVVGGTGTNVARGLSILSDPPLLATDIGNDSFARAVAEELDAHGLSGRLVRTVDRQTPLVIFVPESAGGPAWEGRFADSSYGFALDPETPSPFPDLSLLHLGGATLPPDVSLDATRTAVEAAREHDVTVSFDLNGRANLWPDPSRYAALLEEMLAATDIVFAGTDDLALAGRSSNLDGLCDLLPTDTDCTAFLTRGEEGSTAARLVDGVVVDQVTHHGFDVDVVDPAGAGDAFVAGVLSERRNAGATLSSLLRAGNAAGAAAVTSVGPLRRADASVARELDE